MIKVIFISLSCFVAICSTSGYIIEENNAIYPQIYEIHRFINSQHPENAVFVLADLYIYVNEASGLSDTGLDKDHYLQWLDNTARRINPQVFLDLSGSLSAQIDPDINNFLDKWRIEFTKSRKLCEPIERIDLFFRRQIEALIQKPGKSPSALVNAIIDGKGLCNIFNPSDRYATESETRFSKFAYVLREFSLRKVQTNLSYNDMHVLGLQKLGIACSMFRLNNLGREHQKAFLSSILDNTLKTPVYELNQYVAGNDQDICNKLKRDGSQSLITRFVDLDFISLFLYHCIDDLAERWSNAFNVADIQMYQGALFSRWSKRLEQYVSRTKDKHFVKAGLYLERLVKEVPANDAKLAYEQGAGLCNIIDGEEFAVIGKHFTLVERLSMKLGFGSLPSRSVDISGLITLKRLRAVCLLRRGRFNGKRSHAQIDEYE